MSLEELLSVPITVASRQGRSVRESPGVVTLVTREEIINSGARDMIDVLRLVPGFDFGVDVAGVVGVGFRGNWGHEGKVLLLWDGIPMNETLYSTTQFGNHYPVDSIERIEIVRGPGSAIYGGYAELAVINVVTRGADDLKGAEVMARGATMTDNTIGQAIGSASWAGRYQNGLALSLSGNGGIGNRSNGTYRDFNGGSYPMANENFLDARFLDVGASFKRLAGRLVYDGYDNGGRDAYSDASTVRVHQYFSSLNGDLQYAAEISPKLTITPRITLLHQEPWLTPSVGALYYHKIVERNSASTTASFDATPELNVLAGVEGYQEVASLVGPANVGLNADFAGKRSVNYRNGAAYSQVLWNSSIVNVAVGARFERHSAFGNSFVPRAALTRVFGRYHLKLLFADSFRAPSIENININPAIKPERTRVFEAEGGVRLSDKLFLSANAFDISIKDPIVYAVLTSANEGYFNFDRTGTTGGELDLHAKFTGGYLNGSVSFATPAGKNSVDLYKVPGHGDYTLGFPHWKLALNGAYAIVHGITVSPSAVVFGERYGYVEGDGTNTSTGISKKLDPTLLLNVFVNTSDLLLPRLSVGAGVYNILGTRDVFLQPYNGGHGPLPGASREVVGRVSYGF